MQELTYEEFCAQPLTYTLGLTGDTYGYRELRNKELGVAQVVQTPRDKKSGTWGKGTVTWTLDGDARAFANSAELYVAWMHKVCGVKEPK